LPSDRSRRPFSKESFADDRLEDAPAIAPRVEVAGAVDAWALEAGHFGHAQTGLRDADVDERLDLEPVAIDM
jgi:hypothetical protein